MVNISEPFFMGRLEELVRAGVQITFSERPNGERRMVCTMIHGLRRVIRFGDTICQALALAKDDWDRGKFTQVEN